MSPRIAWLQIAATVVFATLLTGALKEAPVIFPGLCQTLVIASSDGRPPAARGSLC